MKALFSMLATTTSGRLKELVKQGSNDRSGVIAFERARERFGKTPIVAKLTSVFQFQWTSGDGFEDKSMKWVKRKRHVNMTSLGDDARETLASTDLTKANVNQYFENDSIPVLLSLPNGDWCCRVNVCLLG